MNDVKSELGPEFADLDVASLHPRRLVNDHLFGDD
jgi:sec-independent protein translocase protein TatB